MKYIALIGSLLLLSFPSIDQQDRVSEEVMLELINELRSKGCDCGNEWMPAVAPLKINPRLLAAASVHVVDVYKNGVSHTGSDGSSMSDRIERNGYQYLSCAENISWGTKNEQEVLDSWVKSPPHCKNMMGADYEDMGFAGSNQRWVLVLGKEFKY